MIRRTIFITIALLSTITGALRAQHDTVRVNVAEHGIRPDTRLNIEPVIRKLLKENGNGKFLQLVFPKGRYDFWPSQQEAALFQASIAFDLLDKSDVCIDGGGSEFVFHGRMMPFQMYHSNNIILRNFSIDWDRPFISQAEIVKTGDDFVDMKIDENVYPYEIVNDSIYFIGEGWKSPITPNYNNIFNGTNKDIAYQTRDNPLGGGLSNVTVTALGKGLVRFHFKPAYHAEPGTLIALYHGTYITNGIEVNLSKQILLENINIFHTLSCGVSAYKSEDITLQQVNIIENERKGRVFSTVADATHFNGCKGRIVVDGSTVTGAGDDFINVHGMYAKVLEVIDDHQAILAPNDRYIGFDPGETAWVVDSATMQRTGTISVTTQKQMMPAENISGYRVTYSGNIRLLVKKGDLLENCDRNPDLEIKHCRILKRHRARGILVTSAGKVRITDNYFNTAGAAIVIEGDTDLWFESGGVRDVLIENNIFENCYTSGNNILEAPWGWGEAVISVTPSVMPNSSSFPAFHHNIRITGNTFKHYDYELLYARSVDTLTFTRNNMIFTGAYPPFYRKVNLYFDGCRHVKTGGNTFDVAFPGKNIFMKNMRKQDLEQLAGQRLQLVTHLEE